MNLERNSLAEIEIIKSLSLELTSKGKDQKVVINHWESKFNDNSAHQCFLAKSIRIGQQRSRTS